MSRHWMEHLDRIHAVLDRERVGFVTDIDGTISPIAATPDEAAVDDRCREHLGALAEHLAVVAAVSGRAAEDARRMIGLERLTYIGNHGLERLTPAGLHVMPEVEPYVQPIAQLLDTVQQQVNDQGLVLENKTSTGSIHYRQCNDREAALQAILQAVEGPAAQAGLKITQGRMVVEIRPPLAYDKGTAVRSLVEDYSLTGAFYAGDDWTDRDAFEALRDWREQGTGATLSLAIVGDETPGPVRDAADVQVLGVEDMRDLLAWLAEHA